MSVNSLVTVIVTTYNRKELLKETIDSILNQTFKNFELIVVDNFSDYDFLAHIKSFNDDRLLKNFNAVLEALEKEKSNNTLILAKAENEYYKKETL